MKHPKRCISKQQKRRIKMFLKVTHTSGETILLSMVSGARISGIPSGGSFISSGNVAQAGHTAKESLSDIEEALRQKGLLIEVAK